VLRTILRSVGQKGQRNGASYSYVMDQYKKNSITDSQYCREKDHMQYVADTYALYVTSSKKYQALYHQYHRAETSVEDAAKRVGLQLPQVPK